MRDPIRTRHFLVAAALLAAPLATTPAPADTAEPETPAAVTAPAAPVTPEEATPVVTPAPSTRRVRLLGARNVVRTGPGDSYAIAGVYPGGTKLAVIAKSGDWYNVRLSATGTGWVRSSLCKEFDDMSDLEFRPNPKLFTRTGSFVLSGYTGAYAFDRKSNSLVVGGRLGYYVFDRLQVEGNVAWTHVKRPAEIVESLFDLTLEAEDFHMVFYHLSTTFEILPGRQMVPFVSAGVGSSIMQGDTETSFNFGAGTQLFLSKHSAMRWEVRDHQFKFGTGASRRTDNNIEFTLGSSVLF